MAGTDFASWYKAQSTTLLPCYPTQTHPLKCKMRLMASMSTAFFALECCTFFDLIGSWALLRMASRLSLSRALTTASAEITEGRDSG